MLKTAFYVKIKQILADSMLINGRKIADKINKATARKMAVLRRRGLAPKIFVFLIGHRPESEVYVRQKARLARHLGFEFELIRFDAKAKEKNVIKKINAVQRQRETVGLIVQLPLPPKMSADNILSKILPDFDIDCLTDANLGRLVSGRLGLEPPTAGAALEILRALKIKLAGKKIALIGAGLLVGRPLALILAGSQATITVCNSATRDLKKICLASDIIISGAGKKNLIKPGMVRRGAVVIDAGFSFGRAGAFGDADVVGLDKKGVRVTPTPGGVGPITVANLMRNAAICAEEKFRK